MRTLVKQIKGYLNKISLRLVCKAAEIKGSAEIVSIVFLILLVIVVITVIMFPQIKAMLITAFAGIDVKMNELLNAKG